MMFSLEGKRCVVTGGGTGIGRGIARQLVRAGGLVAVCGRRADKLDETLSELKGCGPTGARAVKASIDVTDAASVRGGIDELAERLGGGIDVLVNNAGMGGPNACSDDEDPDNWDAIVRTNLDGTFFCSREALRHMPDGGSILNISSVLGRFGVPGYTAYCSSKHGVIGFTKALALEVSPRNITVNAICPGWVETGMARDGMQLMATQMGISYEEAREQALGMVPLGRILEPDEIGGMVVYLASDLGSGITAQALSICGGQVQG
jgi:ketoreductase